MNNVAIQKTQSGRIDLNCIVLHLIAVGTFKLRGEQCKDAVEAAIKAGIRHIDTASIYKNEEDVGAAIRNMEAQGVVTRHELFVTSKASPYEMISGR